MTKKRLKQLFLVPLLAGVLYACYNDVPEIKVPSETLNFSIAEARSWFEANNPSMMAGRLSLRSGDEPDETDSSYLFWRVGDKSSNFTPDWWNATVGADADFRIVEVPLEGSQRFFQGSSEIIERAIETRDERYLVTIMRLLVLTCRETNERDAFVMMASPDLEYLEKNLDNPLPNFSYLNNGGGSFSGLVFFYNLVGELINGYKAVDGKFFEFLLSQDAEEIDDQLQLRAMCGQHCTIYTLWTDWFQVNPSGPDIYLGSTFRGTEMVCIGIDCNTFAESMRVVADGRGGGGDGANTDAPTTPTEQSEPPQPDEMFNITDENEERLEELFDELLANCIGEALLKALNAVMPGSHRLNIQFTNDPVASWSFSTSTITLWRDAQPDNFFHELFHAFQAYGETMATLGTIANNPLLNLEMEARFAQYMFLRNTPRFYGSALHRVWLDDPSRRTVMELTDFLDHRGNFLPGVNIVQFDNRIRDVVMPALQAVPEHQNLNMRYDPSRIGIANFRNFRRLTIKCP